MKRKFLLIIILLISSTVFAGETNLLWKYFDMDSAIYILGSIHLADDEMLPLDDSVYEAWDESDTLVMEIDIIGEMAATQMLVMKYMVMPDGQKLEDFYTEEDLGKIGAALSAGGIPISLAQTWYPWIIEVTLISFEYAKAGLLKSGIDMHFADLAAQENKPVIGLETAEEQIKIFADLPMDYQAESLLATVEELPELEDDIKELIENYKNGNLEELEKLLEDSGKSEESAEFFEKIFSDRNKNWAEQIAELADKGGSYFIVVGAGHLLGEESVIKLLAEKGYEFSNW